MFVVIVIERNADFRLVIEWSSQARRRCLWDDVQVLFGRGTNYVMANCKCLVERGPDVFERDVNYN